MFDPVAAGRRAAYRALVIEIAVAVLVTLAFLLQGPRPALAAAAGGGAMILGNAAAAGMALGGGIQRAQAVFARLVFGTLAKWAVVAGALVVVFGVWRLPPLPALVGVVAGVLAYPVGLNFSSRIKRER